MNIQHLTAQHSPPITHAILPEPIQKTARTPSKLRSTPPVVSLVMSLPQPFPRSVQRTRSALALTTSDIAVTARSHFQQRRSTFWHSELPLMRPNTGMWLSNSIKRHVKSEFYLIYCQFLADQEATVFYRRLADFDCDWNNGQDKNRRQ
jgi:hypothetical protein